MRILLLADIHIGSITDTNYVYSTLTDIFDQELLNKKTDMVVLLGDYFDRLFRANEDYISVAINVMSYLVRICRKNKIKIRIVYGTESHEMNQYRLFNYHLTSKSVDMKVFNTVTEEEVDGKKILYVPEEFVKDKKEFYKDTIYSGKHYDYIFGHGVILEGMPKYQAMVAHTVDTTTAKVPYFDAKELSDIAKIVVFGHMHIQYDSWNVHYVGSLFRTKFGEEKPKRYGIIEDDEISFVENPKAYIYDTFEFDEDSDVYESADKLIAKINEIKSNYSELLSGEQNGKIRLIFHPPVGTDPSFVTNVHNVLFNDKMFKSMIDESTRTQVDEENVVEDEYEFVLDKTLKPTDKIYRLIDKLYEDHMSAEELINYIMNPISI